MERIGGYRVVRRLATTATSDVLLAKSEGPHGFERAVVLKLLHEQYTGDDRLAKLFTREASAYARLSHPAIVTLNDFLLVDGRLVMVLEHVDGAPLSRVRGMLAAVGHDVDDTAAMYVGAELFGALAAAHRAVDETGACSPLIHRDVNPTNVLVGWDGSVKLGDFGLAKAMNATHESVVGIATGAYGYLAPEQVRGTGVMPETDVYAAAIVLWEMLTHRRAFRRATREIEMWRAMAEPVIETLDIARPDLDPAVRGALRRALQPRLRDRDVSAAEIETALREQVSRDAGRRRMAELMEMVRHEPIAAVSVVPEAEPVSGRSSLPALGAALAASAPAIPGRSVTIGRAPHAAVARGSVGVGGEVLAAVQLVAADPDLRGVSGKVPVVRPEPALLRRPSSAKIPAVRPLLRRTSSGKMPAVRPQAPPLRRTPSAKLAVNVETPTRRPAPPEPEPAPPAPRELPSSFPALAKTLVVELEPTLIPAPAPVPAPPPSDPVVDWTIEDAGELGVREGAPGFSADMPDAATSIEEKHDREVELARGNDTESDIETVRVDVAAIVEEARTTHEGEARRQGVSDVSELVPGPARRRWTTTKWLVALVVLGAGGWLVAERQGLAPRELARSHITEWVRFARAAIGGDAAPSTPASATPP